MWHKKLINKLEKIFEIIILKLKIFYLNIKPKIISFYNIIIIFLQTNKYINEAKTTAIRHKKISIMLLSILILFITYISIPIKNPLFEDDYSTVLVDQNEILIGAYISDDQQWRFPEINNVPEKYKKCLLTYEDKNFYYHPGVDPIAIVRAVYLNTKAKKIVSGGSTITMQIVRLSRKGKPRTIYEKIIEAFIATRIELKYSKKRLLTIYASHAPFGGNVVGLEAAAWRYFARSPSNLSWAESSLLAVLPNSPALIHPGRNTTQLKNKRDKLLEELFKKGIISKDEFELSKDELLPNSPHPIPQIATHLLMRTIKEGKKGQRVKTSIDSNIQIFSNKIIDKHYKIFSGSKIYNAAAIVVSVDTGEVVSYVGNINDEKNNHGNYVDIITSRRSPGSLLKPFLYAFVIDEGLRMPEELVPDIPIVYHGFAPKNFSLSYDGAISMKLALSRSLNIPFVYLLQEYGYNKFYRRLEQLGLKFPETSSHYALSMILGSAEASLWDLTSIYASMARVLKNYGNYNKVKNYSNDDYFYNRYIKLSKSEKEKINSKKVYKKDGLINAGAIWCTFEAMKEVIRPNEELKWKNFTSSKPIAWKTGTSYGNKDAWAIGITSNYVIGVWVGNADGEGRPEIKGIQLAAPILFDIFDILPDAPWLIKPKNDLEYASICRKSGMLASRICDDIKIVEVPKNCLHTAPCKYHKTVHLDENEEYQVDSSTYPVNKMIHKPWFILPPIQEMYYKNKNSHYKVLPESKLTMTNIMELVYPAKPTEIYVPIELDGTPGKTIFELAHRRPESTVYWHLDGKYIGETKNIHQMGFFPDEGSHQLVLIDEDGNQLIQKFNIISRKR